MIKKIVMFIGGVETLEYFSYRMGDEFQRQGYSVFYYDLEHPAHSVRRVKKFMKPGETVLITFNFEGLEKEEGLYEEGLGYIWESYGIPCYNIAADHPYYYENRLKDLPKDYRHISIDRLHEKYFKEFYPEFFHQGFLPLAGTELPCVESERSMDVVMTGNFTPTSFCEPYIHWINDEYAAFYQGIIDDIIAHPTKTVEETALCHCEREMGKESNEDLRVALYKMIFIDLYVRNYWRGETVRTLVDSGIQVDVFGKGWEDLACSHPENLILHPQITSVECLEQLRKAKVSLNVMPWFKDGAHDRVFNSVLNGAVCFTDRSGYLCEELKEGEGVCYYELEHLALLPDNVKKILSDEKKREEIISKGRAVVSSRHTWVNRAETMLGWIREDVRFRR